MDSYENIIEGYKSAAIQHREALNQGNSKVANRNYAKLTKMFYKFQQDEELINVVLLPLLESEDVRIRTCAAAHCLGLKTNVKAAENVLRKASGMHGIGILRLVAETTLQVWKEQGYLKF